MGNGSLRVLAGRIARTIVLISAFIGLCLAPGGQAPVRAAAGGWTAAEPMTVQRYMHTATLLADGRVLVAGGDLDGNANSTSSVEIYQPTTNTWVTVASMHTARHRHEAVRLQDGRILVIAGWNTASTEVYDPATGVWTETGDVPLGGIYIRAVVLDNGNVLAVNSIGTTNASLFNPTTNQWSETANFTTHRFLLGMVKLADGRVMVSGGRDSSSTNLDTTEIYDPQTGLWTAAAPMGTAREEHFMVLLNDGRVLVAGGNNQATGLVKSAEIYDPTLNTWMVIPDLNLPHLQGRAVLLADSRVLVAGGNPGFDDARFVEILDPTTFTWEFTGSFLYHRVNLTTTLLPDGRVLAAGGAGSGGYLNTTEIFDPAAPAVGGFIRGRVTDEQGNPLPNIPLNLSWPHNGLTVCTNANGDYIFNAAFNIAYRVQAVPEWGNWCGSPNNYATQYWNGVTIYSAATTIMLDSQSSDVTGIDFVLRPGGGISGHVFEADGVTPVEGACVNVFSDSGEMNQVAGYGSTGADGSYSFWGVPTGEVYIHTHVTCEGANQNLFDEWYAAGGSVRDGAQASPVTVTVGQQTGSINFQLDGGGSISGHVYEAGTTTPVEGVRVIVQVVDQNDTVKDGFTDAEGSYTIGGLPAGTNYRIRANMAGYLDTYHPNVARFSQATQVSVTEGQATTGIDIQIIQADSYITGRVTYQDGSPASHVWMEAFHQDGWFVGLSADENGEYALPVIAGTWQVFPYQPPLNAAPRNVTVSTGQTVSGIDFAFAETGTISGRVTDAQGSPLANIAVNLDGPGYGDGTCTNSSGEYVFDAPLNVEWRVHAAPEGENWCGGSNSYATQYWNGASSWDAATTITLDAGSPDRAGIDFALQPGGGISGHVYEADGVTPVEGACVNVSSSALSWNQVAGWGRTGADGSFAFWGVPTGEVYLRTHAACGGANPGLLDEWYAPGGSTLFAVLAYPVNINVGQQTGGINFQLDLAGSISGHVYRQDGVTPIAGALVSALDDNFRTVSNAESQPDGSYFIDGLPGGAYRMMIDADGYGGVYYPNSYDSPNAAWVTVTAPGDTPNIDFTLSPEATVSGHVYQSDGATPINEATVLVWPKSGGVARRSYAAADGSFTVHGLATGDYVARASAGGYEIEFYQAGHNWATAVVFAVTQPQNTPNINFTLSVPAADPPESERQALASLYQAAGGANWLERNGWPGGANACAWSRVICHDGHVAGLYLQQNNLTGALPAALANLPELRALHLSQNNLSGQIPAQLGNLANLMVLRLNDNAFSGAIPGALAGLANLFDPGASYEGNTGLDLGYNRLAVPEPYPSDPPTALEQFLMQKDPDWQLTQSVVETIPDSGGTITSRDGDTTVIIPPSGLAGQTTFIFVPQETPNQVTGALAFAGNSFQLEALDAQGNPLEEFIFGQPVTLALQYSDADIAGIEESSLRISYWDGTRNTWRDAATTCSPTSVYTRDLDTNTLLVDVCHLSEFALLGVGEGTTFIYLPTVRR